MRGKCWMLWSMAAVVAMAVACGEGLAQAPAQTPAKAPADTPAAPEQKSLTLAELKGRSFQFEVASIRPNTSGDPAMSWSVSPNNFQMTNVPLRNLVMGAYGIKLDDALVGLPKWAENDRYNISAKVDDETVAIWKRLDLDGKKKMIQMLEQNLLAERCQFKAHKEIRQLPAYDLVVAKSGVKMKDAVAGENGMFSTGSGKVDAHGMEMWLFTDNLTSNLGRTVVDKTGLHNKRYTFTLKWTPDEQQGTADAGPSIYAALEEQLGLKLVANKAPVEIIVVDKMERPSEN
ncbi:MAG: TIGR03435 family protein [Terracidiphilus sp.]|nr:TIGR03435 family protein [Terracidiphilus sp.]